MLTKSDAQETQIGHQGKSIQAMQIGVHAALIVFHIPSVDPPSIIHQLLSVDFVITLFHYFCLSFVMGLS